MKKIQMFGAFAVLFSTVSMFAQEAAQSCPKCPECSSGFGLAFFFLLAGLAGGFFVARNYFAKNSKPQSNDHFLELDAKSREIDELKLQLKKKDDEIAEAKSEMEKVSEKTANVLKKADEKYFEEISNSSLRSPLNRQVEMIIDKLKADLPSFGVRNYLESISVRIEQFNSAIRTKDGTEALRVAELFVKDYEEAKDTYKEEK